MIAAPAFAFVGPSGAGKDSVLAAVAAARPDVLVARRVITRPADPTEPFEPRSREDFAADLAAGRFVLDWQSHGLSYGVPTEARDAQLAGRVLLVNLSRAVLPRIMQKMEAFGCPRYVTSFVIPTGYSFNLDGSTLYQSIAAIFIAQLYNIHMPLEKQLLLVLTLMLTSKGIAGVPGVSFVVLLATLGTVGIPVEGLAFIAGIDRILDMARTAVNVVGNSLAAVVMSRFEGEFDDAKSRQYVADMKAGTLPPLSEATGH